jgi:hypothetical protein
MGMTANREIIVMLDRTRNFVTPRHHAMRVPRTMFAISPRSHYSYHDKAGSASDIEPTCRNGRRCVPLFARVPRPCEYHAANRRSRHDLRVKLFVDRLQLLLGGLQLLIGGLQLLIDRNHFLVRGLEFLQCAFIFLDRRLQALLGVAQLAMKLLDARVASCWPGNSAEG